MSAIEWTDCTWNPIRGCSRVSEGCRNCYAERMAARFETATFKPSKLRPFGAGPFSGFTKGGKWTGRVELISSKLDEPLRWKKPRRVFVNSMSDLFHESLPDDAIARVFAVMLLAPRHTFQVLTKRPARMRAYLAAPDLYDRVLRWANVLRAEHPKLQLSSVGVSNPAAYPARHIWLGVSVEDQRTAEERIPLLLQTPAAVRFVSYEPALGPVDLAAFQPFCIRPIEPDVRTHLRDIYPHGLPADSLNCEFERMKLDWVIVGGESGPGARPCDVAWVRSIRDQCKAAGVACFVKQLGARPVDEDGDMRGRYLAGGIRHDFPKPLSAKVGDPAQWPEDLRVREFPA